MLKSNIEITLEITLKSQQYIFQKLKQSQKV